MLLQVLTRLDKENIQATKAIKEQHATQLNALKAEHASALAQVLDSLTAVSTV
jgi:hypothetical protein